MLCKLPVPEIRHGAKHASELVRESHPSTLSRQLHPSSGCIHSTDFDFSSAGHKYPVRTDTKLLLQFQETIENEKNRGSSSDSHEMYFPSANVVTLVCVSKSSSFRHRDSQNRNSPCSLTLQASQSREHWCGQDAYGVRSSAAQQ